MGVNGGAFIITQSNLTKLQEGFQKLAVSVVLDKIPAKAKAVFPKKVPKAMPRETILDQYFKPLMQGNAGSEMLSRAQQRLEALSAVEERVEDGLLSSLATLTPASVQGTPEGFMLLLSDRGCRELVELWLRQGEHETVAEEYARKTKAKTKKDDG